MIDENITDAINVLSLESRGDKPFDDGPYADEVFTYQIIDVEMKVLAGEYDYQNKVSDSISSLIVEIVVKYGYQSAPADTQKRIAFIFLFDSGLGDFVRA